MIFFQVINGTIYYRGTAPLHQHVDGGYITEVTEPTCTDKGYTTYICQFCGPLFTADETEALGHSWTWGTAACQNNCGLVKFATIGETIYATFADAIAAAQAGDTIVIYAPIEITTDTTYNFANITINSAGDVFVVTSGTLTLEGDFTVNAGTENKGSWCAIWANGGNVVINGGTYSVGGDSSTTDVNHQNDLIYTKNGGTVTINGGTFKYTEGVWALNQHDATGGAIVVKGGTFEGFNPANNASEGANTSFVADGYAVVESNGTYTVVNHIHTEVEIPAVLPLPSNGHTFTTAGIKCSECGEIIVAPETKVAGTSSDANFKINSANLSLGEDITITYDATHPANSSINGMYMVFIVNGRETIVDTFTSHVSGNRYSYNFKDIKSYEMADNIEAYVYAVENGAYVMKSHLQYSIMQYCVNQLKKNPTAAFKQLIFDVLYLGECSQKVKGHNTNALVTDLVEDAVGYELNPTIVTTIDPSYNVQALAGDRTQGYDWKSGQLSFGSSVEIVLDFTADSLDNLVLSFAVGNRTIEIDASEAELVSGNRYSIRFQVMVSEYAESITCNFIKDGVQTGSTLTYSIYTYIVRNYTTASHGTNMLNFMKSIYAYSEAAKVFAASK